MNSSLPLAPRYRLDDEQPWLIGIDPIRRYWLAVNGDESLTVTIAGLQTGSFEAFREGLLAFRRMQPGEKLELPTATGQPLTIHCIGENCFALSAQVAGNPVVHLFDQEALESLLMTAHPDWQCAPHHAELGRNLLTVAWQQASYVHAA